MKLLILILTAFLTLQLHAQDKEAHVDSIQQLVDSVRLSKFHKLDTVQNKFDNVATKVQTVVAVPDQINLAVPDSLNVVEKIVSKIEGTEATINAKVDSLSRKVLPLDRIVNIPGKQVDASQVLQTPTSTIGSTNSKLQQLQDTPEGKVNETMGVFSKEAYGQGNLPANANLPNATIQTGQADLPTINTPGANQPGVNMPTNPLNLDLNVETALEKSVDLDLDQVQESTQRVGEVSSKISGYTEDAKNISTGDIDKVNTLKQDAMDKASLQEESAMLSVGDKVLSEQKALIESFKNPEEYKKQTLARAQQMAIAQLALREKRLQEVINKVSSYHKTSGTILNKRKDLPKKRDPLKKLKAYERVVPGITLQVLKSEAWLIDLNPSLRYRITSYWSAGAGWNERLAIGKHARSEEQLRVYGIRSFSEVVIFRGLSMRFDAEYMNAFVTPTLLNKDVGSRLWVWSYMAGIKKEFSFAPKVMGNVQFLYNLYDPNNRSPYPTRFNVRFGFEHIIKRKKKK